MAQQLLNERGIMPDVFFNQSFSNWIAVQNATGGENREVDPLEYARQLGAL